MEQKLEKTCNVTELEIGERYCMSGYFVLPRYIFTVISKRDNFIHIEYLDNILGAVNISECSAIFYEFPLSSLEKELL